MLESLYKIKFQWGFYIGLLILIKLTFMELSWYSFIALAITLYQLLLLLNSVGHLLPIRYLSGTLMCLQMLLGPTLAFNGLDDYAYTVYKMKVSEAEYFTYVIPAMILFILGLHITAGKLKGEVLNKKEITAFVDRAGNLTYIFIGVGFIASFLADIFSSDFAFILYLLGSFKFIGAFMLIFASRKLKAGVLALVYGSIVASSLQGAMFHDLLTWIIMLGAVLAIKYKPGMLFKAIAACSFILLAVIIQQVKGDYRRAAWSGQGGEAGVESFENAVNRKQESNSLFSFESLAESNVRINQGFIVTRIMNTVPSKVPFAQGTELMQILEAAFLPRILAPNKLNAGDREIFMKYSGMRIKKGTSMALSSVGDAYLNFGLAGGCVFMFCLGLLFSSVLNGFYKYSKYYPFLLLFTPLVFYYPIRPDCELQTSLGHLVKACVLIYIMILFWKQDLQKKASLKIAIS